MKTGEGIVKEGQSEVQSEALTSANDKGSGSRQERGLNIQALTLRYQM